MWQYSSCQSQYCKILIFVFDVAKTEVDKLTFCVYLSSIYWGINGKDYFNFIFNHVIY